MKKPIQQMTREFFPGLFPLFLGLAFSSAAFAGPMKALPDGKKPDDVRLGKLRTTDSGGFPMQPITDASEWPARREAIRLRILVAAGLQPMPKRSPLNAIVYGKVEREDYTVERVIFESFPGHFVTGSLYRPKSMSTSQRPAVLCPHGHWPNGRFFDVGLEEVRKEIAAGAERFEVGGRRPVEARCVQLARMGCVAFVYDMEGYADSVQLNHYAGPRPESPDKQGYLFFSPEAELHGQTMFGLQTWNSIRALDFICSLPDVDTNRIAVTGASGGGTQSLMIAAIDDRIAASFPVCMVSPAFQGGCTCENAAYLRINQGNVDIAAANAPRPLGLCCADDWTKVFQTNGDGDLRHLYAKLGHPENYEAHFRIEFPHNYNAVNRSYMYSFMNRHLRLGLQEPIIERDYVPLDVATEASVWTAEHPKPAGENAGDTHERKLTSEWTQATDAAFQELSEPERQRVVAAGLTTMIGRLPEQVGPVKWDQASQSEAGDYEIRAGTLTVTQHGEQLPAMFLYPIKDWNRQVAIWLTDSGKAALFGDDGKPISEVAALLDRGYGVASVDLFGQGEFLGTGGEQALQSARLVRQGNGNEPSATAAGYTFGYNPPLLIERVHDVISLVEFLRHETGERKPEYIDLIAVGQQAGPAGLIARCMLGNRIERGAIDTEGFDFTEVKRLDDPMMLPGILRYGGMNALWHRNRPPGTVQIKGRQNVAEILTTGRNR